MRIVNNNRTKTPKEKEEKKHEIILKKKQIVPFGSLSVDVNTSVRLYVCATRRTQLHILCKRQTQKRAN